MIPAWTMAGVLPPIPPGQDGVSAIRSPYVVPLSEVIEQFGLSLERIKILNGLLAYRAALHKVGVVSGFQWLDGSFMEDVETLESRAPNDIDVVTYFDIAPGLTQATLAAKAGNLFNKSHVKNTYFVDAYPQPLGGATDSRIVRQISYWYSMWSHRRDGKWKGFIQVSLDPKEDINASKALAAKQAGGKSL